MSSRLKQMAVCILALTAGCPPADREMDRDVTTDTLPTVTAQFHRQHVQDGIQQTRTRYDAARPRITQQDEGAWDRLSRQAEEAWRDMESRLADLGDDPETVRRDREESARRLAELEESLVEEEVKLTRTPEELREVAGEWLERLQSDLSHLEQALPPEDERRMTDLDRDDLRDLRNRLDEVRMDVEGVVPEQEEFEDRREDVAEELADLTREIREARYTVDWGRQPTAQQR